MDYILNKKLLEQVRLKTYTEDELNKRISTIVEDNDLLLDPKSKDKDLKDKKPKPILS